MGVSGLTRVESATRRRNCALDSLAPTPASVGAILPKARSPGTAWQRVQAPASRFTTMLRPRAASPGSEVRAAGIASPTTSKRTCCATARPAAAQATHEASTTTAAFRRPRGGLPPNDLIGGGDPVAFGQRLWIPACAGMTVPVGDAFTQARTTLSQRQPVVLERQRADALAGRGEDRVAHRRRDRRLARLADAAPEAARGREHHLDPGHLA